MAQLAASMADTSNHHLWDIAIIMGEYAQFSTEYWKTPPPLSIKLAAHFVGPFHVLHTTSHVSFQLQLLDDWAIHNVFHTSYIKPSVGFVDTLDTSFCPEADKSGEFEMQDILDSCTFIIYSQLVEQFFVDWKG